jgi:hypothetical protein
MSVAGLQSCSAAVVPGARWAAVVGLACALAAPLRAQTAPPARRETPFAIMWGKWATAALAVGFTALGVHQHNAGDAAYTSLINYCRDAGPCPLAPDGRYANPQAEAMYQRVVRNDRSARGWLIGGQVAAVGSAVLFVLQLSRNREPPNIPYSGLLVESGAHGARLGWRIPLK